jgi:hypothetical protein
MTIMAESKIGRIVKYKDYIGTFSTTKWNDLYLFDIDISGELSNGYTLVSAIPYNVLYNRPAYCYRVGDGKLRVVTPATDIAGQTSTVRALFIKS